jgi:ketosteroid isomerase-like protein
VDVLDGEGAVAVLADLHGRTRHDQAEIDQKAASLWTVRDGRVVRIRFYLDRDEALRDAGLLA